jgi:hypothetical protein
VGQDPAYWVDTYSVAEPSTARAWQADALELCGHCPVAADCLDFARSLVGAYGIWGGHVFHQGREKLPGGTPVR